MQDLCHLDKIIINQLQINCIIGIYPEEKNKLQPIILTIEIYYDHKKFNNDDGSDYICYKTLADKLTYYAQNNAVNLIETLAQQLINLVLEFDSRIQAVKLLLNKVKVRAKKY